MNDARNVLAWIRARDNLNRVGTATSVDNSQPVDWDAVIEQAIWDVSQPDEASPESVAKARQSVPVPAQCPVSSMSVRHQRKLGLPVCKAADRARRPPTSTLLDRFRACRLKVAQESSHPSTEGTTR